ncbi:MAG: PEPxxWA-CTERM sorting domain-containing protein [Janthinobacterium lividum]
MIDLKLGAFAAATAISLIAAPVAARDVRTLVLGGYSLAADKATLVDLTGTDPRFDHHASSAYDLSAGLPTLSFLRHYDSVLLFTDSVPVDLTALSDLLGQYVDRGGGVVISTFWGQGGGSAGGKLNSTGYNPLINPNGSPYEPQTLGSFDASDPLMANVTTLASEHFSGDYDSGLDTGATLVASWASGRPLAAYNAAHTVVAVTLNPNVVNLRQTTGDYRPLFANALAFVSDTTAPIPEPAAWSLMVIGFGVIGIAARRRAAPLIA